MTTPDKYVAAAFNREAKQFKPDTKAFERRVIAGLREIKKQTVKLPNVE